jgi:hypothetical protein
MAIDLGTDVYCIDDIDPAFAMVSGSAAVAQAIARRFDTPRGGLHYDGEYGYDLVEWMNRDISDADVYRVAVAVESEALKDERVLSADAVATYDASTETLSISLRGVCSSGPFQLVLSVDDVSVTILRAG